jgi:hypothetical protein
MAKIKMVAAVIIAAPRHCLALSSLCCGSRRCAAERNFSSPDGVGNFGLFNLMVRH